MTQGERRRELIRVLLAELPQCEELEIPETEAEQRRLLRSLMNVRPPRPVSQEFLQVQDAYLMEETERRGIVDGDSLPASGVSGRLVLWRGDITRLKVDAIVNAANSALLGCFQPCHSCIDNIIHSCAGVQLRLACHELMQGQGSQEPTGRAKLTPGYNLPCRYILHTVGPVISGRLTQEDCRSLASCYQSCLELAVQHGIQSVAFCCISTGVFHFPQDRAAEIAVETVRQFLQEDSSIRRVIFDVFTDADDEYYSRLLKG